MSADCKTLHERYADSFRHYEQALLEIETCKGAHAQYQAALAAQSAQTNCAVATTRYQSVRQEADACRVQHTAWESAAKSLADAKNQYLKEVQIIDAQNAVINKRNAAAQASWVTTTKDVETRNGNAKKKYDAAALAWQMQNGKYLTYKALVQKMRAEVQKQWDTTRAQKPFLNNYTGYPVTVMCDGTGFPCISKANQQYWAGGCVILRGVDGFWGLGATQASTKCQWKEMPVCPSCPTAVAHPGNPPAQPNYLSLPAQPRPEPLLPVPTWEQWATNSPRPIGDPGPRPTCNPTPTGWDTPPACDPTVPIPEVGNPPGCQVPTYIPTKPVPPACDPGAGLFSGTGAMWLGALALGGGLYYLARKK